MRYTGPARFRFSGDIGRAQRYTAQARTLVAQLFASSSVPLSTVSRTFEDGTVIAARYFGQPAIIDRNWADDPTAMVYSGQMVVSVEIYSPPVAVSIPEFTGFVLEHPNAAAFDSEVYGVFFDSTRTLNVTSASSDLDAALSLLDFFPGSPTFADEYPEGLYDDVASLEHVDWHNTDHSICLTVAAVTGDRRLPRYHSVPVDRKIYRDGEVFVNVPLGGVLRGWGIRSGEPDVLVVIMQSADVLAAFQCPTTLDMTVVENWILISSYVKNSVQVLDGCFLFSTDGSQAVTSLWSSFDDWQEILFKDNAFEVGPSRYNPFQLFQAQREVYDNYDPVFDPAFGDQENFQWYSTGGNLIEQEFLDRPPGSNPGVGAPDDYTNPIVTPFEVYRRGEFNYVPELEIDDFDYYSKKLLAVDFITGTTTLSRLEVDYSDYLLECGYQADHSGTGTVTDTYSGAGPFEGLVSTRTQQTVNGSGEVLGRLQEGNILINDVSAGWVLDVDSVFSHTIFTEFDRTQFYPGNLTGNGTGAGLAENLTLRKGRTVIASDLRHNYVAVVEMDQRFEYRISEDLVWTAGTSTATSTLDADRTLTPNGTYQRLRLIELKNETENVVSELSLPTRYNNIGLDDSIQSSTEEFTGAFGGEPSFLVSGFGPHFFFSGLRQLVPYPTGLLGDTFPGWKSGASETLRAQNFTLYEKPYNRFGYFREGAMRIMYPLQSQKVASMASRRGAQAVAFYGNLYNGEGEVKELVLDGRTLSTFFRDGAEDLYDDLPPIGVV